MILPHLANLPASSPQYSLYNGYAIYEEAKFSPLFFKDSEWEKTSSNSISLWQNEMKQKNASSAREVVIVSAPIVDRSESNLNFIHEQELLFPKKVRKTILVQSEFSGFSKNKLATVINNNVLLQ